MLEEHNAANEEGKKVKNQVDIAAIIAVAEMNDHALFENVTNKVKNRITMEEAKAMAKKETIDHDAVLRNFRETASSRAEQAHKNAAAPTP
jgi:adenosyl cobinamide kinase/adenosyl cobinamide phosphate guanylyltransferase